MRGLFVTGTDTNVGKTLLTGAIAAYLKDRGIEVGVMKPAESGTAQHLPPHPAEKTQSDPGLSDALFLKEMARVEDPLGLICPYHFTLPLAPGIAAELEGKEIQFSHLLDCFQKLSARHSFMLVEGAGGLYVPFSPEKTVLDLIALFKLPVLLVARAGLGTLNHTLLSIECLEREKIPVAGIILNHTSSTEDLSAKYNARFLKRWTEVPLWGEFPWIGEKSREALKREVEKNFGGPFSTIVPHAPL